MQHHSFNAGWPSSSPVEELHAEQEVSEEELLPQQEAGGTGECPLSRCAFMLVLIWPSWLWLGGRNEEEEQPGEQIGGLFEWLVGFGGLVGCEESMEG